MAEAMTLNPSYATRQSLGAQQWVAANRRARRESVSGVGSNLASTGPARAFVAKLLRSRSIGTLVDLACGDRNWIRHVDLGSTRYVGLEVVPELVAAGKQAGADVRLFNALTEIPAARGPRAVPRPPPSLADRRHTEGAR